MIEFSTRLQELISQPTMEFFYCVKIDTLKYCTHYADVTIGGDLYTANGPLVEIDVPKTSSTVERNLYKIVLTDNSLSIKSTLEAGIIGSDIEVRVVFIDYYTKQPELNETFLIYGGFVESFSYEIDTSDIGQIRAIISCSNPMADLDLTKPMYTTKDHARQENPGDTSYDQIYEGSGKIALRWGKK